MRFDRPVLTAVTFILLVPILGGCQLSRPTPQPAPKDSAAGGSAVLTAVVQLTATRMPMPTAVVRPKPSEPPVPTAQPVTESTPTRIREVKPATAPSPSPPTAPNRLGQKVEGGALTFIFDEGVYGLEDEVASVAVAGNFNEWKADAPEWQLHGDDSDGVWTLRAPLGNRIRPGAAFIFVADGQRLQPPSGIDPNYLIPDGQGGFLLVVGGLADLPQHDEIIRRLERKSYTDAGGTSLPYDLLIPRDYDPSRAYPLVIFLHGSGERGDNLAPVLPYNGAYEFMETARAVSYFMLIPQAPNGAWWDSSELARLVLGLLDEVRGQFSIDPTRIYITGLSMGAFGMWSIVSQEPEVFAAGVSVCGGLRDTRVASEIAHIPFEVFHGSDDSIVPVAASRATVSALEEAGGAVQYVEYEGADHWIWQRTYTDPEVIDWLFKQKQERW